MLEPMWDILIQAPHRVVEAKLSQGLWGRNPFQTACPELHTLARAYGQY